MDHDKRHIKHLRFLSTVAESVDPVANARIASALVLKNEIISIGMNRKKTHPLQAEFSKHSEAIYLHAEMDAISRAIRKVDPNDLSRSTLYICRVKKSGCFGLSRPCIGCIRGIANFDIKNIVYTTENNGFICTPTHRI